MITATMNVVHLLRWSAGEPMALTHIDAIARLRRTAGRPANQLKNSRHTNRSTRESTSSRLVSAFFN